MKQFLKEIGPFALCVSVFIGMALVPQSEETVAEEVFVDFPVEKALFGQEEIQRDLHKRLENLVP